MKLCVIGAGYVGLVTAACFADLGNEVVCVDKVISKIRLLSRGIAPFFEPGIEAMVQRNIKAGRLTFNSSMKSAVQRADVILIAVGTPSKDDGEADVSSIVDVAREIAGILRGEKEKMRFRVIVNKSTVPVGMGDIVTKIMRENKVNEKSFAVVSNPEFLREGSAIMDFMNPDRIVIGAHNDRAFNLITEIYRPLNAHIIFTSVKSAELIKYASNAFLATKISFVNEIANICERTGSDINEVVYAVGLDKRIGRHFFNAGIGYGGSCLPKDVSALIHLASEEGYEPLLLNSVNELNNYQVDVFVGKIVKALKNLRNKKLTLLGITFKPETDDLREAPALKLVKRLKEKGAKIRVFDPAYKGKTVAGLKVAKDVYSALSGADALVLATEWNEFRELDFERVKKTMKQPFIFDGRNVYDPKKMKELGFNYRGVGR
jgi:UDPglucose 6-dehydrogenase